MARILFVSLHDWLFAQRHLPAVRAARELGYDVSVATRARHHGPVIEAAGAGLLPIDAGSGRATPQALWRLVSRLNAVLDGARPDIVQFHGLRAAMAGAVAARLAGCGLTVFSPGGLGAVARGDSLVGKGGAMLAPHVAAALIARGGQLVFDNPDDAALLGLTAADDPATARTGVHVLPGLGVDPLIHSPEPMPWMPPLKFAFGSTLLWSNGPDVAVEAVTRARVAGANVTLSLIGGVCQPGPQAVPEATLKDWSRLPGISWFAPAADVAQVWRQHHMLILPSRGGDGLPLLMTEAASGGRAILTTDVGGCGSFVRDGIDGLVVPKDDIEAMANAMTQLSRAPGLVERMGRSARERVLDGYTERHVMEGYKRIWLEMLRSGVAR